MAEEKITNETKKTASEKKSEKVVSEKKTASKKSKETKKAVKSIEKVTEKAVANKKKEEKTKNETVIEKAKKKKEIYDILEVEGYHHLKLHTYVYDNVENPKAVVLIVHGMMEHALRYYNFAKFLNENGYIVIANDLRGHGHSAIDKKYGYGEKDIFFESVQDEIIIL